MLMGRKFKVKIDRSLRENAGLVLPEMSDRLLSYRNQIVAHPEDAERLHEMRIAGRPMRYIMEAFAPAFGSAFAQCLADVKRVLDVAGLIHDADVMIGMLDGSLRVLERRVAVKSGGNISLSVNRIQKLLLTEKRRRAVRYNELRKLLLSWNQSKFKRKLLVSMR